MVLRFLNRTANFMAGISQQQVINKNEPERSSYSIKPKPALNNSSRPPSSLSELIPDPVAPGKGQFLVYEAEDGCIKIDVRLDGEALWLPQAQLAALFQTRQQNIRLHIQNIHEEGELLPEATYKKYLLVRTEGGRKFKRQSIITTST